VRRLEVIAVGGTFEIRDILKARGYRFGRSNEALKGGVDVGELFAMSRGELIDPESFNRRTMGSPGWSRIFESSDPMKEWEAMQAELAWALSQGWECYSRPRSASEIAASSFLEGRPDLL
jgi:hypothetical protein